MKRTFVRYVAMAAVAVAAAGVVADTRITPADTGVAQEHAHLLQR